jgi:hypothetical protein
MTALAVAPFPIFSLAVIEKLLVGSVTKPVTLRAPVVEVSTISLTLPDIVSWALATPVNAINNVAITIFFISYSFNKESETRIIQIFMLA